ncbi:membrane protein insertion efficiency factor YidD [Canibacter zhoujuaniae]|uniref:membrane protein insertion efficiency factor YidD n=1 Tax=Canibacter zhoujuaniae TaxID=2708343 RepID=UPI001422F5F3|nr:membrane protein insertion efficiency factor YidD [Canibacter zhoujuaniae]
MRVTRLIRVLVLLPRNFAIGFMRLYRAIISPLYGDVCKYYPSCSRYALEAYQQRSFVIATGLTVWRLLRCNPFSPGGVDHVHRAKQPNTELTRGGFVRPAS